MNKAKRNARLGMAAIGTLLLGLISGCGSAPTYTAAVSVQTVQQVAKPVGDSYLGVVTPFVQTSVAPAISGVLQTVNVRVGDKITPGQLLATINTDIYKAQLNQAQAGVTTAQAGVSATQQGTSINLKNAASALEAAEAALTQAQAQADASVQAAQKAYDAAMTGQDNGVAGAQKAVATAQTQLQNAQVSYQSNLTTATAALNAAQVGEKTAQDSLASAQSAVDTATTGLNKAQQMAHSLNDPNLLTAQSAYDQAVIANQAAQAGAAKATAAVQQAQAALDAAQNSQIVQTAQAQLSQAEQALASAQSGGGATSDQAKTALDSAKSNAAASIAAAKSKVAQAQTAYETSLNNPQLEVNSAQIQAAQASVQLAQTNLDKGQITAPLGGYVVAVNAQVGQAVGPQGGFIVISSMDPLMVTVDVTDKQVADLQVGTDMDIYSSTTGKTYSGTVSAIHPSLDAGNVALDSGNQNFPVDIIVTGTPTGLLSGMQVEAHRVDRSQQVMLVPANAVMNLGTGEGDVFVVKDKTVHVVHVKLGELTNQKSDSGADYSILSGLTSGDQVVIQGQNQLSDGDKVSLQ